MCILFFESNKYVDKGIDKYSLMSYTRFCWNQEILIASKHQVTLAITENGIAQDEAVSRKLLGATALELSNRILMRKFN